jgi:general secretion pathway protein B
MSFILDALKKSESDRQRKNGPALFEVKVAPPRTRLPLWAVAIAGLLVVNLAIVMWMVLRHPARAAAEEALASAATATAVSAHPATAAAPAAAPAPAPTTALAPSVVAAPAPAGAAPTAPAAPLTTATRDSAAAAGAASVERPGATSAAEESNPDDYAPAQEHPAQSLGNHVKRGTAEGVPLYQDAAGTPGTQIPQLRLDLHVFAERPQDRFVMINMHKLREGETLPEGVHVDSITPDGAILSYRGTRFLLPRE